jgi:hypothetical protein
VTMAMKNHIRQIALIVKLLKYKGFFRGLVSY